ncbi:MAG TPA: hypothetical protein VFO07_10530 [Roseiflexaceae bacterium]|nr:hypothetical protein [Roseiflexaceae bacterium]
MSQVSPEPVSADSARPPSWRRRLFAVLPHVVTIALAVAIGLALQAALSRPGGLAFVVPTPAPPTPTAVPAPTAVLAATGDAPAPAPDIVRQELLDLRAEDDRLWAAVYLARAISQVSDAEAQMRANDLEHVAQSLVAVDGSLELAYERADESIKSPIEQLRQRTSGIHDDLYIRPEGMDGRLAELRQIILTLIGERR